MNSHEVVRRAIEFRKSERIPYDFRPIGYENLKYTDFFYIVPWHSRMKLSEEKEVDKWGCIWRKWRDRTIVGEPVGHPLEKWDNFKEYRWPDPDDPNKYAHIGEELKKASDKFVYIHMAGILLRARMLRGFSNLMIDFYLHPQEVRELLQRILDWSLRVLHNCSKFKGVHGISIAEDWGTQRQLFLRVPMFREFFSSIYKRLFETVHSYGWIMRMHSDGKINDLIEDFISYGLDVIELEQPRALGIKEIGRRFRGRICFEGSIDIQATLPTKNKDLIREEAKSLIENWATPEGGFIAVCYHGSDIGVSSDVVKTALEAFQKA